MRIGLVRRGYSSSGGAEAYLFRFAAAAHATGHQPVLVSGSEWPDGVWPHEHVVVAGNTPEEFADQLEGRRASGGWDVLFSLERVWGCDVYRAGDGVHAAWLERRRPFEPAWRGWFRSLQRKHREILELECALFTGGARRVIANSQMVKDEIIRHYGTPAEQVHVVHNGVPPQAAELGAREALRQELGIAPQDFVALFAGTGWDRKGLRHAIAAVKTLKIPVTLLVAGRGDQRGLPASDRVKFLGALPGERLRAALAAADVFVLPTLYDPFSNACIEALAAGLPVVTTTANGFSEILESGVDGDVVAPGDTRALADALASWADPQRRAAIRPRLLEKAARCSVEENLARTLEVITAAS
jgi:UDP-glucose:(heptosyl)LPS alpha-1,3-glucosyltransferase